MVARKSRKATTVRRIVADMKDRPGPLIEVLHAVQAALGYVPPDAVPILAEALNLSRAEVHGVVSFYHYFRETPPGQPYDAAVPGRGVPGDGRRGCRAM